MVMSAVHLGLRGAVTANAGVVVDNITIDGTEIDLSVVINYRYGILFLMLDGIITSTGTSNVKLVIMQVTQYKWW